MDILNIVSNNCSRRKGRQIRRGNERREYIKGADVELPSWSPRGFAMTCDPGRVAFHCFINCSLHNGVLEDTSRRHCTHNVLGVAGTWTSTKSRIETNRQGAKARLTLRWETACYPKELRDTAKWIKDSAKAMFLISTIESEQLEPPLVCLTGKEKLTSLHEQKSASNKLLLTTRLCEYRMSPGDTIIQHVAKEQNMATQLPDVGFQTAWDNVAPDQQTLNNLQERLIRKEARLTVANEETGAFSKCKKNGIKKNDAGAQNKITKSDCQIGKLQRKVLNKVHERPATKPAEVFHMNDDATRFHYVYFLRHKSDEIKKFKMLDKIERKKYYPVYGGEKRHSRTPQQDHHPESENDDRHKKFTTSLMSRNSVGSTKNVIRDEDDDVRKEDADERKEGDEFQEAAEEVADLEVQELQQETSQGILRDRANLRVPTRCVVRLNKSAPCARGNRGSRIGTIDIQTASLHDQLEEQIYMEVPECLSGEKQSKITREHCLLMTVWSQLKTLDTMLGRLSEAFKITIGDSMFIPEKLILMLSFILCSRTTKGLKMYLILKQSDSRSLNFSVRETEPRWEGDRKEVNITGASVRSLSFASRNEVTLAVLNIIGVIGSTKESFIKECKNISLSLCSASCTLIARRIKKDPLSILSTYLKMLRPIVRVWDGARIVGGQQASPGQFPWQAAIYKYTADGRYFCGGTLYNEQWILTAGQCVIDATEFTIQLGSNQLDSTDNNRIVVNATTYYVEPRFDPTVSLRHDVGMIKLPSPVTVNDYIQPVRMLESMSPIYKGVAVETAGWGQTADSGDIVNDLNYVQLKIIANTECQSYYGDQFFGSMTCTEGSNYNEGFCFGDVGGALLGDVPVGDYKIQVGISSFISQNGCESLDPTGYTRTDAYFQWMHNISKYG
ncbi:hypothetical protein GEV33_007667 [Tenebrio molitor]|uniref:Peptidase S1 domain-containing protein n=1 Tax=Tenebrio molitor TaxID=7067 RepID=A0A8J6LAV3_TENMO|nr:hypothetical protein GEV33_007667 [Tenebrio molitor]